MLPSCKRTWGTKPFTWPQTNVGLLSKCCLKFNAIRTIHSRQKANRSFSIRCLHMKGHHHGCGIRNCWRHVFFCIGAVLRLPWKELAGNAPCHVGRVMTCHISWRSSCSTFEGNAQKAVMANRNSTFCWTTDANPCRFGLANSCGICVEEPLSCGICVEEPLKMHQHIYGFGVPDGLRVQRRILEGVVDGSKFAPVEFGSLSYSLQGLLYPRWCRISPINSIHCEFLYHIM